MSKLLNRLSIHAPFAVYYCESSVVDPDPNWIQIRFENPDPRGQKLPTKIEKS